MPYTRTEGFLSPGSVCVQQFIPNMAEWKKKTLLNSAFTPGHRLRFQMYQNLSFSSQTNLGDVII